MHINKNNSSECNNKIPNKPIAFPKLKEMLQIQRKLPNACCTILQDDHIKEVTESFLPGSCLRKYPEFEDLLCLGCAHLESIYIVYIIYSRIDIHCINIVYIIMNFY